MNKEKLLYERALITCMVMLFVCIVLKIFGVEWFNLDTSIPLLNKIDEIIMNSDVLSFVISLVSLSANNFLILGCSTGTVPMKMLKFTVMFIPINIVVMCTNNMIIDIISLIVMGYLINRQIKSTVFFIIVNLIYQIISIFIRGIGFQYNDYNTVIVCLMNLDYYLMSTITYLFVLKGGFEKCFTNGRISSFRLPQLWKKHSQSSNPCSDKG